MKTTSYETIKRHITSLGDGKFQFDGQSTSFNFSRDGLNYLYYRLGIRKNPTGFNHIIFAYENGDFEAFAQYVNEIFDAQIAANPKLSDENHQLISAVVADSDSGIRYLAGLLTRYKPFSNDEVASLIDAAGLTKNIDGLVITNKRADFRLRSKYVSDIDMADDGYKWTFGTVVRNGETGHYALQYRTYISLNGFTYVGRPVGNTRHFDTTRTSEIIKSMQNVFEQNASAELLAGLKKMTSTEALALLSDTKFDKIKENLAVHGNALDVVTALSEYTETRGLKTAAKAAINKICDSL